MILFISQYQHAFQFIHLVCLFSQVFIFIVSIFHSCSFNHYCFILSCSFLASHHLRWGPRPLNGLELMFFVFFLAVFLSLCSSLVDCVSSVPRLRFRGISDGCGFRNCCNFVFPFGMINLVCYISLSLIAAVQFSFFHLYLSGFCLGFHATYFA